jgi:catechol 2,3-dioxygenase-like lactoylglutathione lyase family enzyme
VTAGVAVYAGLIVRDLDVSCDWYRRTLGCRPEEDGPGWASLRFADGSTIELFAGDPDDPASTFPSYRGDTGPPVMPGYSYDDPEESAAGLVIQRRLPEWIVVRAPDGLRLVLTSREGTGSGIAGFRFVSPEPNEQRAYLSLMGVEDPVEAGDDVRVIPVVHGPRDDVVLDPDGTAIEIRRVTSGQGAQART